MVKYLSLNGLATLLNGVFTRIRSEVIEFSIPTSGNTNGVKWFKFKDGTCVLYSTEYSTLMSHNANSGAYEKTIEFPFTVYNPVPTVTTIYRQGQPKSTCMEVTSSQIIVGAEAAVSNYKVSWFVVGRWTPGAVVF